MNTKAEFDLVVQSAPTLSFGDASSPGLIWPGPISYIGVISGGYFSVTCNAPSATDVIQWFAAFFWLLANGILNICFSNPK